MEFPAAHGDVEGRAGTGDGQFGGPEARRTIADDARSEWAELALEAGLPPGVLNVVPGTGEAAGQALARHMDVDMIAFTGSGPSAAC